MGGTTPATCPFCCHQNPLQKHQGILKKRLGVSPQTPKRFGPNIEEFLWHDERSGCSTPATLFQMKHSTLPPWWHEWHHLGKILGEIHVFSLSLSLELNFKRHEDPILPFLTSVFSNLWGM